MAVLTFNVNMRIKRYTDIKVIINTLIYLYGNDSALIEYTKEEICNKLKDEILLLEKMHDDNYYVEYQIKKIRQLRLAFLTSNEATPEQLKNEIKSINLKNLSNNFIILAFLNISIPK